MSATVQIMLAGGLYAVLTGHTVTDGALGSPVSSTFNILNTGVASYSTINNGSGTYSGEWNPVGYPVASFDVRWTNTSGTPDSGSATATWLNCATSRSWTVSRAVAGSTSCTGTVEIRDTLTGAILASASVTIQCTYT